MNRYPSDRNLLRAALVLGIFVALIGFVPVRAAVDDKDLGEATPKASVKLVAIQDNKGVQSLTVKRGDTIHMKAKMIVLNGGAFNLAILDSDFNRAKNVPEKSRVDIANNQIVVRAVSALVGVSDVKFTHEKKEPIEIEYLPATVKLTKSGKVTTSSKPESLILVDGDGRGYIVDGGAGEFRFEFDIKIK